MANLKQFLEQLHLSEKEIAVFLSLVKLGRSPVSAIARDSGITRTHIYDIVEELKEKGLVSEVEIRRIKAYEAVDHAGLLAFVSRQEKNLHLVEKKLTQLASEFNALRLGEQQKTKVRFFDGIEGVKNIYEEIRHDFERQSEPFEILTIFSPHNLIKIIPDYQFFSFPGMEKRDIVCADESLLAYQAYQKQMNETGHKVQCKVWPLGKGMFLTDNIAWKNKITYIDLVGYPSGIIIENESVVKTFTMWFNGLWESLK